MNTVWVLTYEINEYEQDGEYLAAIFENKPSYDDLKEAGVPDDRLINVMLNEGRINDDWKWFHLRECELNFIVKED